MEVKIMEWNINQRGRNGKKIPLWILDEVSQDINVLIFVEFNCNAVNINEFYKKIKEMGFDYRTTDYSHCEYANDILIAIRGKEIRVIYSSFVNAYPDKSRSDSSEKWDDIPENLRVDIEVDNKTLTIFGVRIKNLERNYNLRRIEMETTIKWLQVIKHPIIISGDFNNLREKTPESEWNLKRLDQLLNNEFTRVTPTNFSWGVKYSNGKFVDPYIKNDHIIYKDICKCEVGDYEWNFLCNKEYKGDKILAGLPDHGILKAKVEL